MSPLPTNQHLPRRSRRLQHGVSHSGQICPLHHACNTCPRGPKDQNQRSRFSRDAPFTMLATPVCPFGPADRHLRDASFTWQHLPCCPGDRHPEMLIHLATPAMLSRRLASQRCLIHLATPAMLSRRQAPRDASFTWQHLPCGPGKQTTQQPLQRFPLYWQHVNTCPRGPEYQTTEQSLLRFPIHLETPVREVLETKPQSRLSRDVCIFTRYLPPAHASDFKQNKKNPSRQDKRQQQRNLG